MSFKNLLLEKYHLVFINECANKVQVENSDDWKKAVAYFDNHHEMPKRLQLNIVSNTNLDEIWPQPLLS